MSASKLLGPNGSAAGNTSRKNFDGHHTDHGDTAILGVGHNGNEDRPVEKRIRTGYSLFRRRALYRKLLESGEQFLNISPGHADVLSVACCVSDGKEKGSAQTPEGDGSIVGVNGSPPSSKPIRSHPLTAGPSGAGHGSSTVSIASHASRSHKGSRSDFTDVAGKMSAPCGGFGPLPSSAQTPRLCRSSHGSVGSAVSATLVRGNRSAKGVRNMVEGSDIARRDHDRDRDRSASAAVGGDTIGKGPSVGDEGAVGMDPLVAVMLEADAQDHNLDHVMEQMLIENKAMVEDEERCRDFVGVE